MKNALKLLISSERDEFNRVPVLKPAEDLLIKVQAHRLPQALEEQGVLKLNTNLLTNYS